MVEVGQIGGRRGPISRLHTIDHETEIWKALFCYIPVNI